MKSCEAKKRKIKKPTRWSMAMNVRSIERLKEQYGKNRLNENRKKGQPGLFVTAAVLSVKGEAISHSVVQ